ncbi:MAG: OmpA family protein [Archangium sp.]|nr:OmpA family protein [Archangium sp.]
MPMTRWVMLLVAALGSGCATTAAITHEPRDVSSLVTLEGDAILVKETIGFPHGKSEIEESSKDLLDAVARILLNTTSITKLTVEGHTDTTGEPAANQPLSEERALAVKKYLESKGVDPSRLESRGFGSSQPVDSNDTEAGRAKNRRVEFKVTR